MIVNNTPGGDVSYPHAFLQVLKFQDLHWSMSARLAVPVHVCEASAGANEHVQPCNRW